MDETQWVFVKPRVGKSVAKCVDSRLAPADAHRDARSRAPWYPATCATMGHFCAAPVALHLELQFQMQSTHQMRYELRISKPISKPSSNHVVPRRRALGIPNPISKQISKTISKPIAKPIAKPISEPISNYTLRYTSNWCRISNCTLRYTSNTKVYLKLYVDIHLAKHRVYRNLRHGGPTGRATTGMHTAIKPINA